MHFKDRQIRLRARAEHGLADIRAVFRAQRRARDAVFAGDIGRGGVLQRAQRAANSVLVALKLHVDFLLARKQARQLFRRAVGDQPAVRNNHHRIAHRAHLGEDMAGQDDRVLLPQHADQIADLDDLLGVKADGRLVEDDDFRIPDKRLRNAHALAIALGKVVNQPAAHIRKAGAFENFLQLRLALLHGHILRLGDEAQVFADRHIRIHRRNFRQIADAFLRRDGLFENIVPVDDHLALARRKAAGNDVHCGRFARAVRAEQAVYLARLDGETQIVHGQMGAVALRQMSDLDQLDSPSCFSLRPF